MGSSIHSYVNPLILGAGPAASKPLSPATGGFWAATDLGIWIWWNGARWLGPIQNEIMHQHDAGPAPYGNGENFLVLPVDKEFDTWMRNLTISFLFFNPHDGSNNCTFELHMINGGGDTIINSINSWLHMVGHSTWDAILDTSFGTNPIVTTDTMMYLRTNHTGSPGDVYVTVKLKAHSIIP